MSRDEIFLLTLAAGLTASAFYFWGWGPTVYTLMAFSIGAFLGAL